MAFTRLGVSAKQSCNSSYKLYHSPAHLRPCVCKLRARGKLVYCNSRRRSDSEVETARSEADTVSQHVQAPTQEQSQGVDPSARPEASPQRHGLSQVAGIALGIAVLGAAVWSLVTVWKRKDDKLRRLDTQSTVSSRSTSRGRGSRSDQKRRRKHEYQEFAPEELAEVRGRIICRQFARTGTCKYGDDCWYRHERDPEAVSASAEAVGRAAVAPQALDSKPLRQKPQLSPDEKKGPGRPGRKGDAELKELYAVHGTYLVPVTEVPEIGALMGYRGTRIKGVCYVTGTDIVVPRTREADMPVSIDIYANDEASLQKAQQMIDECFAEVRKTAL